MSYNNEFKSVIKEGKLEKVKEYMENNNVNVDDTNYHSETALMKASEYGKVKIVEYLVDMGADIGLKNTQDFTALMYATQNNINEENKDNYLDIVKILVKNGVDIDAQNMQKWTALMYASNGGNLDIIKFLIENNADIDIKNNQNQTALDLAKDDNVRAFLSEQEQTFRLIRAVMSKNIDMIKQYLMDNRDLNITNSNGETALMLASKNGYFDIVIFLVASGADINIKNNQNKTALKFAVESGNLAIIKFLLSQGADTGAKK